MKKKSILKREDKGKDRASPAGSLSLSGELEPRLTAMREINGFFFGTAGGVSIQVRFWRFIYETLLATKTADGGLEARDGCAKKGSCLREMIREGTGQAPRPL